MGLSSEDIDKIKKIFSDKFLNSVAERVVNILENSFLAKVNSRINEQDDAIAKLKQEVCTLRKSNQSMEAVIDQQEQTSRNLNVRVFGVSVKSNENLRSRVLDVFNNNMGLHIEDWHISKCYRVAAKNPGDKPPAILIKFISDVQRSAVLRNCKQLKSSGIVIKEDLTKFRLLLVSTAIKRFTNKKVWTTNGMVYIRKDDGTVQRVNSVAVIEAI